MLRHLDPLKHIQNKRKSCFYIHEDTFEEYHNMIIIFKIDPLSSFCFEIIFLFDCITRKQMKKKKAETNQYQCSVH